MSQPGPSKQVRDNQDDSEVFSFFFLQKRFSKKKKITNKHTSKSQTDNAKIKNEK